MNYLVWWFCAYGCSRRETSLALLIERLKILEEAIKPMFVGLLWSSCVFVLKGWGGAEL